MTWDEKRSLWEKIMGMRTDGGTVEDLFEKGKPCDFLSDRIYDAQHRLLSMLGVEESYDIDEILCCEDAICMHVAIRMFDYGMEYGRQQLKRP